MQANKEFHVAVTGNDHAKGTKDAPFRTISKAASVAQTGDKIIVHEGEYREWVKPQHSGYSEISRITYEAAAGEKVVIKGSEIIKNWEKLEATTWKAVIPNDFFGDYNPYKEILTGDWYIYDVGVYRHPGEVYLNGKSFYEADSLQEVLNPVKRTETFSRATQRMEKILHPEDTVYQWYCEVNEKNTVIYANFQGADPNKELVEINVRRSCFFPDKVGMNYITVRGFEMAQAATPWAPPAADQPALLGVNWSKGWIIENNIIHDSKCSAISIGKEASTGHNLCSRRHQKPGYQYQMEAVFRALQIGWSKEKIGSHIIRNNTIYDCGQNGIVGHLGCVFSDIHDNHIYNIAIKHEFFGYELGGIKLHTAIDVRIHNNRIHNCTLGTWLDWQAQGARVSSNLYYNNDRDIMIEVTHGPCIVDNNIFASPHFIDNFAQGTAYINNLICGVSNIVKVRDRATPYHFPHSTQVAGFAVVFGGDDRYYNNIFVGNDNAVDCGFEGVVGCGTAGYNGNPSSYEDYVKMILKYGDETGDRDHEAFFRFEQPVYIDGNTYLNGAKSYKNEKNNYNEDGFDPQCKIIEEDGAVYLEITLPEGVVSFGSEIIDTEKLGTVRIVDAIFDDYLGNMITFDSDYMGQSRLRGMISGPLASLKTGKNKVKIW